jgi:hypothetical protein
LRASVASDKQTHRSTAWVARWNLRGARERTPGQSTRRGELAKTNDAIFESTSEIQWLVVASAVSGVMYTPSGPDVARELRTFADAYGLRRLSS